MLAWLAVLAFAEVPDTASVVLITHGDAVCAGTLVDDAGTVLTAYHCIIGGGRAHVALEDGSVGWGKVVAQDVRWDLAVLEVPALAGKPHATVRTEPPAPGDEVWAVGHPFGASEGFGYLSGTLRWSMSRGEVSRVGARALQTTAPVNPGNSGGPLFDASGDLVGVVSRKLDGDGIGFATRADRAADLIASPEGYRVIGGQISLDSMVSMLPDSSVTPTATALGSIAVRDRAVLWLGAGLPLGRRWDALTYGDSSASTWEARFGLRQRAFRGQMTFRFDVSAGVVSINTTEGFIDPDDLTVRFLRSQEIRPIGTVGFSNGIAGLDWGFIYGVDETWQTRIAVRIAWPGRLWLF